MAMPIDAPLNTPRNSPSQRNSPLQRESPSQTAGPYVHIGLAPHSCGIQGVYGSDLGSAIVTDQTRGERITLELTVIDGSGAALKDALVEIWQADADGVYPGTQIPQDQADAAFAGWGRSPADNETGLVRFETIKPGKVPFADGLMQAPHINLWIVARGINLGLNTRIYFDDESLANQADPVLSSIEHRDRVPTLIARREGNTYRHDIRLQGPQETVFFDI